MAVQEKLEFGSLVLTYGCQPDAASPDAWGTVHKSLLDQHRLTLLSSQIHSAQIHTGQQYLQP